MPSSQFVVAVGQCERGLVGAADLRPQLCRALPLAAHLQRIRLGSGDWDLLADPCLPTPVGKLPDDPRRLAAEREREARLRFVGDRLTVALEPGSLASRNGDWCEMLELAPRTCQLERLVEQG